MIKSESIAQLSAALVAFQKEARNVHKGKKVPGSYTYATLESILDSIKPGLSKNGLAISQLAGGDNGNITVTTILMHECGEYWGISNSAPVEIPLSKDGRKLLNYAQSYGAQCTYYKKYQAAAIVGIATTDDEVLDPDAREDNGYDMRDDLKKAVMDCVLAGTFSQENMQAALTHYKVKGIDDLSAQQLQAILTRVNKG